MEEVNEKIWVGRSDGSIQLIDKSDFTLGKSWKAHESGVVQAIYKAFHYSTSEFSLVWTGSGVGEVSLWKKQGDRLNKINSQNIFDHPVLRFLQIDPLHVWSISAGKSIVIWNAETGEAISEQFEIHEKGMRSLIAVLGQCVWSSSVDGIVCVWKLNAQQQLLLQHQQQQHALQTSPQQSASESELIPVSSPQLQLSTSLPSSFSSVDGFKRGVVRRFISDSRKRSQPNIGRLGTARAATSANDQQDSSSIKGLILAESAERISPRKVGTMGSLSLEDLCSSAREFSSVPDSGGADTQMEVRNEPLQLSSNSMESLHLE